MLQSFKVVLQEFYALFVDDGSFAIGISVWLGLIWLAGPHLHLSGAWSAALLFVGLVAILTESTLRRARR
jgi:hypothetical protein